MCCKDPVTTVFITLPALIGAQHRGRNPACPPPPMRPLCYILKVWVTYLLCCQVMFMCVGSHVLTVWLWVCEGARMCVCTGSVDCSSWKRTCVAQNFLRSLTITSSWKQPVIKWPLARFGDWGSLFPKFGLWIPKRRDWIERWLFIRINLVPPQVSSPVSYL